MASSNICYVAITQLAISRFNRSNNVGQFFNLHGPLFRYLKNRECKYDRTLLPDYGYCNVDLLIQIIEKLSRFVVEVLPPHYKFRQKELFQMSTTVLHY